MPVLPGGDVVPSFLGVEATAPHHDGRNFDNTELRLGEVQDIVYPNDKRSRSKKFVEYRVLIQQRSNRTGCAKIYENCILANPLGGVADYLAYTLRADHSQSQSKDGLGRGSKVLVLCVNGETNTAVILGGVRDQTDQRSIKDQDLKHHLDFEFNGVGVNINNDGEMVLTYKGATNIKGKPVNDSPAKNVFGTNVQLLKDGSFYVIAGANLPGDASQTIHVDPQNDQITVQGHKQMTLQARGGVTLAARDNNLLLQAQKADAKLLAKGGVQVKGSGTGVALGDGGQALVLGNKHTDDLQSLLQTMAIQLGVLGAALTAGGIGGAGACAQIVQAIAQFVVQMKGTHLSRTNSTD